MEDDASLKAKTLIDAFEKGNQPRIVTQANIERISDELAQPGTAKKIAEEFEEKNRPTAPPEIRRLKKSASQMRKVTNVLVVNAHPVKESLGAMLTNAVVEFFKAQGAEVNVSCLHAMNFNPVASPADFGEADYDRSNYIYSMAAGKALEAGQLAPDVVAEQEKVAAAELTVFSFPLTGGGLPAILKGWFDRVLDNYGWAYTHDQVFDTGKMQGRRAVLCATTNFPTGCYGPTGILGDIGVHLWPIQNGLLRFYGFDVLKPQLNFGVYNTNEESRACMLSAWQERLADLLTEAPLPFVPIAKFGNDHTLADADVEELAADGRLTVGQHCGRQVAASCTVSLESTPVMEAEVVAAVATSSESAMESVAEVQEEEIVKEKAHDKAKEVIVEA